MQLTRILTAAVTAAFLSTPVSAQLEVFGGAGVRASTMVGYWSDATQSATGLAIQYGQGQWKDEYDQKLDQLKGKRARLGKDWWTTLDTSLKLDFGGVTVPPGSYFLGLQCDQDGKFALALLDANKALAASAMPFLESAWKIDLSVPMTLEKGVLKQTVERMTIALEPRKDDESKITLSITWGKHRLSATCKAGLPADKDAGGNKDEKGKKGQTAKVVERGTDADAGYLRPSPSIQNDSGGAPQESKPSVTQLTCVIFGPSRFQSSPPASDTAK